MVVAMFHLAAAGRPLHDDFADKAAAVDGEMVDVINNMPLVRAFCGLSFEHDRFDATVNRELEARGRSSLSRKAAAHPRGHDRRPDDRVLAWAITLWQRRRGHHRRRRAGLHLGAFDLERDARSAVALVDVTQHVARLRKQSRPSCFRTN